MFAAASKTASSSAALYVEDVFSTYLYRGNGSTQTITNGIDLSTKGGLVWVKSRSSASNNWLIDTARGALNGISSEITAAQVTYPNSVTAFNTTGFSLGSNGDWNSASNNYVSWTFRKQPKFFDIVTWTGDGATTRNISHSLGVQPAAFFVKATSTTGDWNCVFSYNGGSNYYMGDTANGNFALNSTNIAGSGRTAASINISSTTIDVAKIKYNVATAGYEVNTGNQNGVTYVAYLFAHNAGGFGPTGTDNVISCGDFSTGSGSGFVSLGYEPQWILAKRVDGAGNWVVIDVTRGMAVDRGLYSSDGVLVPNTSAAETYSTYFDPQPTGFNFNTFGASQSWIYIAIRRGPMKTPTSGTSVFDADVSLNASFPYAGTPFVVDMTMFRGDRSASNNWNNGSRLTGGINLGGTNGGLLRLTLTNAEVLDTSVQFDSNVGSLAWSSTNPIVYSFGRAPGFMDVVCYAGTGSASTVNHNLGVAPEMMIVKCRNAASSWSVYAAPLGNTKVIFLDTAATINGFGYWNNTSPTSSVFTVNTNSDVNASGNAYIAYLFASCPGVSKVSSYTGTGATQTISCGFAARFVLIKRTDNSVGGTANWWVWDTARGMVAGTDPRLPINVLGAESNNNWVYTDSSGFQIVTTDATVNASGGNYIYLAIA